MSLRPSRSSARLLGVLLGVLALAACPPGAGASPRASAAASAGPFAGTALWIATVTPGQSGEQLAASATQAGVHTLFVKAADGSTPAPQFSATLVSGVRAAGVRVCGWTFAYGQNPGGEAAAAIAAVRAGAQCLVVDAEGQYDGLYGAAQQYVHALRAALGSRFPIALAGQAEVFQHPAFPYSVFLGPGAFNVDLPQIYWRDLGVSVDAAFAATFPGNEIYGRPIAPVGQLYGTPGVAEVARFRALSRSYGAPGMSFFDLESAPAADLLSLTLAAPRLRAHAFAPLTLHAGADSDQVVWAQELLDGAGAHLPIGGFFGAQTARALAHFQLRRHLRATGVLDSATWRMLLRGHARVPSWAAAPPDSARLAVGAGAA